MRILVSRWLIAPVVCLAALVPEGARAAGVCAVPTAPASLQDVFDNMFGASAAPNVVNDCVTEPGDALWQTVSSVGSATILVEIAGNQHGNTLGIYDSTSTLNSLEIFSGPAASGSRAFITVSGGPGAYEVQVDRFTQDGFAGSAHATFAHSSFGFYLQQPDGAPRLYSESFRNPGMNGDASKKDYMYAYTGNGARFLRGSEAAPDMVEGTLFSSDDAIIAWEDVNEFSDGDYQDMVVLLRDIVPNAPAPVPLPAAVWLLGSALLGVRIIGRGRKQMT